MSSWFAINKVSDDEAEVSIHDSIGGFGIRAEQFIRDLKALKASTIRLRLNTPGGEVTEATAMYNAIREHPARIVVHVDGLAASAGSIVAMAGDEVRMADNAYMMIHEASAGVFGGSKDMATVAAVLEKMNDTIARTYQKRAGRSKAYWREKMAAETWFTADEAREERLADHVYEADKPAQPAENRFDLKIYNHVPDAVRRLYEKSPDTAPAVDKETPEMATTDKAPPATPPAAAAADTVQGNVEMYRKGMNDGDAAAVQRLKDILAACPGRAQMAVDAFLTGQTAASAKLAFDVTAAIEAQAQAAIAEANKRAARAEALAQIGGFIDGVPIDMDQQQAPTFEDPRAQARHEWKNNAKLRETFSSEDNYIAARVRELNGTLTVWKNSPAEAQ